MPGVLGVDLALDRVTALVADLDTGRPLGLTSAPLRTEVTPGGGRRQDPSWWWDALVSATRAFEGLIDVSAMSVAGPLGGLVCLGREREALGPAVLGCDTSAHSMVGPITDA